MHTSAYKRPDIFRDKRVLIIGAGNSGCDIAVDAVHYARSVDMSMRSGYWFFPKYILGKPSDTLNEGPTLPAFLKTRVDGRMIRLITGNPARLGFPEPDGRIYETHPVMNTLVLYHAGHGDIKVRKDIERFDGPSVRFRDGSSHQYDLVMLATGYRLHYPFIDHQHLNWQGNHPDLYLNIFTPRHRNLFVLGMVEATGLGWQGRYNQADLVAEFIDAQQQCPAQAEQMWNRINGPKPDLFAGYNYRQLDRLPYYVNKDAYREAIRDHLRLFRDVG
jgi:cation diffusion facilitator CzcD-associated flavoprotein CzcO